MEVDNALQEGEKGEDHQEVGGDDAESEDTSEGRGDKVSPEIPESQIHEHSGSAEAGATGRPDHSGSSTQDESSEKEEVLG